MSPGSDPLHRRPDVMEFKQGFPHRVGPMRVKKLVQNVKYRLGTWNIGTLTGKLFELVDTMIRRKINVLCLQETKWVGEKAREIKKSGFKLWYIGRDKHRNGVGIIVDKNLKDHVVEVYRKSDRIILLKFVVGEEIFNVLSVYAPQIGLSDQVKQEFWDDLDDIVQRIPNNEKVFIGGDLNGHVGREASGFELVHGGFGYGERNAVGDKILKFVLAYDLVLGNTLYMKRDEHLVTFKNSSSWSQIDFFLTRRGDRRTCKDCKVIPGESLTTQHRLLVCDIGLRNSKEKRKVRIQPKIKWWNLKNDKIQQFRDKIKEELHSFNLDVNNMWNSMSRLISRVAKELLGETKGRYISSTEHNRESWWWSEDVQKVINIKRESFKTWQNNKNKEKLKAYKLANKDAKRIVRYSKLKAFDNFYKKN